MSGLEGRIVGVGAAPGALKHCGLPSEDAQEKAVVFEVREGGTVTSCVHPLTSDMPSSLFFRYISTLGLDIISTVKLEAL